MRSYVEINEEEPELSSIEINQIDDNKIFDPTPATWNWEVLQQQDIVVDTTLDSATDGNTNPVNDGDATDSNYINFTFSGSVTPADNGGNKVKGLNAL